MCINCKTDSKNSKELIPFFTQDKTGICFNCLEKLDEHQRSFKVYNQINHQINNNPSKKCLICGKKDREFLKICEDHNVCTFCVKKQLIFDKSYPDELQKCAKWLKFCLLNCRNCFREIQERKKVFLITCNFHFYCITCIYKKFNFECNNCKKIEEKKLDLKNKRLDFISTRNQNFKVVLHNNHIYSYEIFNSNIKSLILDCTECREIIQRVQSKTGKGELDNYKAERYEIIMNEEICFIILFD